MKKKFNIALNVLTALLAVGSYLYSEYTRPPEDRRDAETEVRISSELLAGSFSANEQQANTDYVEKTIEVVGNIEKISFKNDRYTVLLEARNQASSVICDLLPSNGEAAEKLELGQTVRLKGICKGYLMDVILLNCILIKG